MQLDASPPGTQFFKATVKFTERLGIYHCVPRYYEAAGRLAFTPLSPNGSESGLRCLEARRNRLSGAIFAF